MCKDVHSGCALSQTQEVTTQERPGPKPTEAGRLGGSAGVGPGLPTKKFGSNKWCTICEALGGVGVDTHTEEWCFCN